MDSKAELIS